MKANVLREATVKTKKVRRTPFLLRLYQWGFRLVGLISPTLASKYAYQLWFTPMRFKTPKSEQAVKASAQIERCEINSKIITTFRWGNEGPLCLLVHGWSGRGTQLGPYVQPLLDMGYQVLSFDLPAHGESSGKQTTLLEVVEVIHHISTKHGPVDSIISHSFGGPCTAMALKEGLSVRCFAAICPPAETEYLFESFTQTLCLTKKTIDRVTKRFEKAFGEDIWLRISMTNNVAQLTIPGLVIHDENDDDVNWQQGESAAQSWPNAAFVKTSGLGHRRILKDQDTIDRVMNFIRS